jgi:hypothetical protein
MLSRQIPALPRALPRLGGVLCLLAAAALAACGGGGAASADLAAPALVDAGVPAAASAQFVASQAAAEALVRDVEQRTRDLRLASGLTAGLKTGAALPTGGTLALAALGMKQAQTVSDYSGTLCSSGSASLDIDQGLLDRFASTPGATLAQGERIGLLASRCVVKDPGGVGNTPLGQFGVGATVDGRFDLTLSTRAGTDIVWTLVYSQFSYAPSAGVAFDPLDATLVFGTVGGQPRYTLDVPGLRFLAVPQVSQVGNTVTISSGQLRGQLASASGTGYADYSFRGWVFDLGTLRASLGSVSASGSNGATALVTASASAYTVMYTSKGLSSSYSVGR